ncbi:sucrase-isomaltase, intestinal [Aplysia californica]|uniref:Sucrase-isomaltase, intestinal n=1 Tax=Aplysia californica TaxID=6500 RepID=A0ABM1VU12_APLCA|nr:sucrase-isomaltase, intestinal [Aplysia californica]
MVAAGKRCVYNRVEGSSAPWCHYPDSYGYRASGDVQETATGYQVTLTRSPEARAGQSAGFDDVILEVDMQTDKRVRVKMYPKDVERWEVPTEVLDIENRSQAGVTNSTAHYNVTFSHEPTFSVRVSRKSTGATIFDTSVPGLVMSEQFLQVTSHLATDRMYGLGEHRHMTLQHDMDWKLWSMFTHDAPLNSDWNLYSQHPVYMIMEEDGSANMVLLKNSNAMGVYLDRH